MKDQSPISKTISFSSTKLAEFGRVAANSGWVKFHCGLRPEALGRLFSDMGWTVPGEKNSLEKLDGKFRSGSFTLTANGDSKLAVKSPDGRVNPHAECSVDFTECHGFECHRLELEGRKGKGFRRELRFSVKVEDREAAAKLEAYMTSIPDETRGTLKLRYTVEPEQEELVIATAEQRQAVLAAND